MIAIALYHNNVFFYKETKKSFKKMPMTLFER